MKKLTLLLALGAILALLAIAAQQPDSADGRRTFRARLTGYEEVPAISSPGWGSFRARLTDGGTMLDYELTYADLQNVMAAHIHFAQRGVNGGVAVFLCGGGDKPACPMEGGTVTGTIDAADVIGPAGQGIAPGELNELVAAMRRGLTYVNVHTNDMVDPPNTGPGDFPAGEIRGQVR
jgi:hypothetical protein